MKALKKCWGMGAVSYLKDLELSCCVRSAFQVGHLDFSKIHVLSKKFVGIFTFYSEFHRSYKKSYS